MNIEIIEEPIRFHLHGISGLVENERYGEVGLRLSIAIRNRATFAAKTSHHIDCRLHRDWSWRAICRTELEG